MTTYLTMTVLLACAPLALWLAWQTAVDVDRRELLMEQQLQARARAIAAAMDAELRGSADALSLLVASGWLAHQAAADAAAASGATAPPRTDIGAGPDLLRTGWLGLFVESPAPGGLRAQPVSAQTVGSDRVAVSVDAGDGRRLGAWIGNPHWQELVEQAGAPAGGFVTLFDGEHRIIARTLHPARFVGQPLPADAVAAMGNSSHGVRRGAQLERPDQSALAAWQLLSLGGWGVTVGEPSPPPRRALLGALAPPLAVAAACLLLGLLLAWRVARKIAAPLATLAAQATAAATEPLEAPCQDAASTPSASASASASTSAAPAPLAGPRSPVREIRTLQQGLANAHARVADGARALQRRAHEFETVFESSPVPLALCLDRACQQPRPNRAMTELCMRSGGGEPQRLRDGRLLAPAEWPLSQAASSGAAVPLHEEAWQFAASGVTCWLLVQATPLLDEAGQLRGAVESAVDVTPLKQAQQHAADAHDKLAQAQQLIDAAQMAGGIGFFQYDTERTAFERTGGHEALFRRDDGGGPQPAPTLQDWLQQLAPAQGAEVQAAIDALAHGSGPWERVVQLPDVGAARRHLTLRMTASGSAALQARTVTGVVVDTSDQRQAAAGRDRLLAVEQQAREAAERASAEKDALLNMLGHELRNPLNALSVAAEVLKLAGTQDPLASDAQQVIERQGRALTKLVNQFLQMAGASATEAKPPGPAHAAPLPAAAGGAIAARPRLVRLVEDNADAAHSVQHALELAGHNVQLSHDGVQGLAALLANPPEIAIVDLGLPGIDGTTLARQARAAGYAGQMLAVSGFDEVESRTSALKSGFDGYMAKPLDMARLRSWIAGCA